MVGSATAGEGQMRSGGRAAAGDNERAAKVEELQRRLKRLQTMVESLQAEMRQRAADDAGAGAVDPVCHTCLTRKKGGALFPCGHTFCWRCTSELRRGKGICPSCNRQFWNVISVGAADAPRS